MMGITTPAEIEKAEFSRESLVSQKIPYTHLIDEATVETKSGHLLQVIKLDGLIAETMDDREIDQEKNIRNSLLKSITDSSTALYFHTIRKKDHRLLGGRYRAEFAKQLNKKWQQHLKSKQFFVNEHYITIVKKPPVGKIRRFSDLFSALSGYVNKAARDIYRQKIHTDLNKTASRILSHLSHYGARKLSTHKCVETGILFSETLSFLSELINLDNRKIIPPIMDLSKALPYKRLFFDKTSGLMALRGVNQKPMYVAILSIREYDKQSAAGMLDHLLDIKTEMVITQSFSFLDKSDRKKKIKEQQRNQQQSDDSSQTETQKIDQTLDELASSNASMGEHHFSILCKENAIESLEKSLGKIDAALNEIGMIAVREDIGIKPAFFAMLPGNQAYITRRAMISSKNMASFASLHNYTTGQFKGNYWGEAVTTLETISGTPFFFNFHVLDVANTFLIGPMGSNDQTLFLKFIYPTHGSDEKKLALEMVSLAPDICGNSSKYNLKYSYTGDKEQSPIRACDDGIFTYFKFRRQIDLPAIFMVLPDKKEEVVNYRVEGSYVVVERIAKAFTLRNGDIVTSVYNDKYLCDWDKVKK